LAILEAVRIFEGSFQAEARDEIVAVAAIIGGRRSAPRRQRARPVFLPARLVVEKVPSKQGKQKIGDKNLFLRVVLRGRFAYGFLHFADSLLGFAFDLLGGIAFDGADHVIDFALHLFGLSGSNIFLTHKNLRLE